MNGNGRVYGRPHPEPVLVTPGAAWAPVREALDAGGAVVVYGHLKDWKPNELPESRLRELLGRDWERFRRFAHPGVQGGFLAARLMMRYAAAAVIGSIPELLDLAYKPGGRPFIRGCDQIDISLSHTGQLLVVGLSSRGAVGVDVERADRRLLDTGIEEQVCTPHERQALAAVSEARRNEVLIRLWTLKEAYTKAIGQGLRFPFNGFGFTADEYRPVLLRPDGSRGAGDEWTFSTRRMEGEYVLSVALHDDGFGEAGDIGAQTVQDDGLFSVLLELSMTEPQLTRAAATARAPCR